MNKNEPLNLVVLAALGGAGQPLVVQRPAGTAFFCCRKWKSDSV